MPKYHLTWIPFVLILCAGCPPKMAQQDNAQPAKQPAGGDTTTTADASAKPTEVPSGEGMWPWEQLATMDQTPLRERGLDIDLKKLWTPGKGGLAAAVVGLRGCSASFISDQGLLITNHHCAFGAIQRNSTPDNNLLENGFVALDQSQELDGHGLRAWVFHSQTDVTQEVLGGLPADLSDLKRMEYIEAREKELVKKCEQKPNSRCRVSRNNDGLSFVLLENLELKDLRLVLAPPRSLGEYGGEVDNWRWPRHSIDFTLLRAYVATDGSPAEFARENVPYRPKHHLRLASKGLAQGDLIMVLGTPYSTRRYRSSASVDRALNWYYPKRMSLYTRWLEILAQTCSDFPDACLPTATMSKRLNNGLTNAKGMIAGLRRAKLLQNKLQQEKQWRQWVNQEPQRSKRFGSSLGALLDYIGQNQAGRDRDFYLGNMVRRVDLLWSAYTITKWAREQKKADAEREPGFQERDRQNIQSSLEKLQRSFHGDADQRVFAMFLTLLGQLGPEEHLKSLDLELKGNYGEAAVHNYLKKLYQGTELSQKEKRVALFGTPLESLNKSQDSMIQLALKLTPELVAQEQRDKTQQGALSRLRPPYIESLVQKRGSAFYPDANATPRISFATVTGYQPKDGVWHTPFTTATGLLRKHTGKDPFAAPANFLEQVRLQQPSPYRDSKLGDVPICFLSNADTTGGNSGSPALNGSGEIVGLNFDRVYENIAGDYGYNPKLSRNILVDVRAILWYLEKVAGANHILKECGH